MLPQKRKTNIDLLRILITFGVILLHWNNPGGGAGALAGTNFNLNVGVLYLLQSLSICAVNIFILIAGYFMWDSWTRNFQKPVELLIETILASVGIYCMTAIITNNFDVLNFAKSFLPANYFVIFYITLYLVSIYINIVLDRLSKKIILEC